MKRATLKAKEALRLLERYPLELSKKDTYQKVEDHFTLLTINGEPAFFEYEQGYLPTLKFLQKHKNLLKSITVDMGAVRFVAKGADIMRPGITHIDENIEQNEIVTIIDENNKVPLAIGRALCNAQEMKEKKTGKVIKTMHYVGDDLWKIEL